MELSNSARALTRELLFNPAEDIEFVMPQLPLDPVAIEIGFYLLWIGEAPQLLMYTFYNVRLLYDHRCEFLLIIIVAVAKRQKLIS